MSSKEGKKQLRNKMMFDLKQIEDNTHLLVKITNDMINTIIYNLGDIVGKGKFREKTVKKRIILISTLYKLHTDNTDFEKKEKQVIQNLISDYDNQNLAFSILKNIAASISLKTLKMFYLNLKSIPVVLETPITNNHLETVINKKMFRYFSAKYIE